MTTARLTYRTHIPAMWIAVGFCNVDFFGDKNEEYEDQWFEIEFEKYRQLQPEIELLEEKLEKHQKEYESIKQEINQNKRWWRFWKNTKDKELDLKALRAAQLIEEIKDKIRLFKNGSFYDPMTLKIKAESFLKTNGFILKSTSNDGAECISYMDIWEKQ